MVLRQDWCNVLSLLLQAHKNCGNMSEIEAKVRYVKLARSLKTYGVSFFLVKVEQQPSLSHFKLTKVLLLQHPSICCVSSCYPSTYAAPVFSASPLSTSPSRISLCTAFLLFGSCFFSLSSCM